MKIKILALAIAAVAAIGAVATLNFPRLRFTVHVVAGQKGVRLPFV